MNIKEAKNEIKNTVKAYLAKNAEGDYQIPRIRQRPMLLIGPPGIGKTQIMEQIARECRIALVSYTITHHTRQTAVGLPMIREKIYGGKTCSVTEYTMSEIIASIYEKEEETGLAEGILFIDEINCVSETLSPTILQFLQCKTFGNRPVPEGWIIVAAGNPPEYNKSVREFDMVTLDRVRYMEVEADYDVWKEYAYEAGVHPAVLSYLEIRRGNFYRVEADADGMHFVTARGWEDLSSLMQAHEKLDLPLDEATIGEYLHHRDVAEDAAAYFALYRKYREDYRIHDILMGNVPAEIYARLTEAAFDERLSVVHLLLDGIDIMLASWWEQKEKTDRWFALLRDYRTGLDQADHPDDAYAALVSREEEKYRMQSRQQVLSKEEIHRNERLLSSLRTAAVGLSRTMDAKAAFAHVRGPFEEQRKRLAVTEKTVEQMVTNAISFVGEALGQEREMLLFLTGLTLLPRAAVFLAEHRIESFEVQKKKLMVGTGRARLLEELER